jgi:methylated-DNA-[protein]-cysteine S-methyltransferase
MEKNRGVLFRCIINHSLTTMTLFGLIKNSNLIIAALMFGRHRLLDGKKAEGLVLPQLLIFKESIERFLDGIQHGLFEIPIDLSRCTPFKKKVLLAAGKIEWGQTISYTELARRAGNERAVRAAASVMRNNRFPLIIPCHRVIRSDGTIGGFMGKQTGKAVELKKRLLEREIPSNLKVSF